MSRSSLDVPARFIRTFIPYYGIAIYVVPDGLVNPIPVSNALPPAL